MCKIISLVVGSNVRKNAVICDGDGIKLEIVILCNGADIFSIPSTVLMVGVTYWRNGMKDV